jgi:hypothetical protein
MFMAYVVVTLLAAGANIYAAANDFLRPDWLVANMTRLRVPQSSIFLLGALKAAGAIGLLMGIGLPLIGISAAAGLVLFFAGAIITALRARWYAHISYPATFLGLAVASLALRLGSL